MTTSFVKNSRGSCLVYVHLKYCAVLTGRTPTLSVSITCYINPPIVSRGCPKVNFIARCHTQGQKTKWLIINVSVLLPQPIELLYSIKVYWDLSTSLAHKNLAERLNRRPWFLLLTDLCSLWLLI